MNTTELKKLAEEAGKEVWAFGSFARGEIRIGPADDLKHAYFATMLAEGQTPWDKTASSKDAFNKAAYISAANPAAILKLLAINAELVEALDELVEIVQHAIDNRSTADMDSFTLQPARAALAKAEGGEL